MKKFWVGLSSIFVVLFLFIITDLNPVLAETFKREYSLAQSLNKNETKSISVGSYEEVLPSSHGERVSSATTFACYSSAILVIVWVIALSLIKSETGRNFKSKGGTIVPQYTPPKDIHISTASAIVLNGYVSLTATIINLAIRHKLRILQQDKHHSIEVLSLDGLSREDSEIFSAIFGDNFGIGSKFQISQINRSSSLKRRLFRYSKKIKNSLVIEGYIYPYKLLKVIFFLLTIFIPFQALLFWSFSGQHLPIYYEVAPMVILFGFSIGLTISEGPIFILTQKGRDVSDYFLGLKMYIKIAEEDRIKVLQSPSGSDKKLVEIVSKTQMVRLYEELLPYAIIFGSERDWSMIMEVGYSTINANPKWFNSNTVFDSSSFSKAISDLSITTKIPKIYSTSGSSSSGDDHVNISVDTTGGGGS